MTTSRFDVKLNRTPGTVTIGWGSTAAAILTRDHLEAAIAGQRKVLELYPDSSYARDYLAACEKGLRLLDEQEAER